MIDQEVLEAALKVGLIEVLPEVHGITIGYSEDGVRELAAAVKREYERRSDVALTTVISTTQE